MNELIQTITVYALPLILGFGWHEAAHNYAARYFGDNTGFATGRLTMNPLKSIDPIGTIVLPIVMFVGTGGAAIFGYAQSLPINPSNFRNPRKHSALVALAGPAANLVMALAWLILSMLFRAFGVHEQFFLLTAAAGVSLNVLLFVFNLLPILPLDGGKALISYLPPKLAFSFAKIEPYGFLIVLVLVLFKLIYYWITPLSKLTFAVLGLLVSPLNFLLN